MVTLAQTQAARINAGRAKRLGDPRFPELMRESRIVTATYQINRVLDKLDPEMRAEALERVAAT